MVGRVCGTLMLVAGVSVSCGSKVVIRARSGQGGDGGSAGAPVDGGDSTQGGGGSGPAHADPLCHVDGDGGSIGWLSDPLLWRVVDELSVCKVSQARLPSNCYPRRRWLSCGQGCRVADTNAAMVGAATMQRGWYDAGGSYVRIAFRASEETIIREILSVEENTPLDAIATRVVEHQGYAECFSVHHALGPVSVETWMHKSDQPEYVTGVHFARIDYLDMAPADVIADPYISDVGFIGLGPMFVTSGTHWAYLPPVWGETLRVSDDWNAPPPFPDVGAGYGQDKAHPVAWGDTFAWHETHVLHAWSPATGYSLLGNRVNAIHDVAMGAGGVVWLEAATSDPYVGVSLWRLALGGGEPELVVSQLGDFAYGGMAGKIVTGDDYAAATLCSVTAAPKPDPADCPLVVVRLSTAQVWVLGPPSPDRYWATPSLVNERQLIAGEMPSWPGNPNSQGISRVFALDVDELDSLQSVFAAP
jgi:hypothetical protein